MAKVRLGLFENPYGDETAFAATATEEARRGLWDAASPLARPSSWHNPKDVLPLRRDLAAGSR
jgi:hypothetical protein